VACSQGGVHEGLLVELSNGGMAVVVKCDQDSVVLDANSMLAGKTLSFALTLEGLERP
jgi:FKBP-type peptidyl-prolyl cis-trans isomerase 2